MFNFQFISHSTPFRGVAEATISIWPGDTPIIAAVVFVMPNFASNTTMLGIISTTPSCDTSNVTFTWWSKWPLKVSKTLLNHQLKQKLKIYKNKTIKKLTHFNWMLNNSSFVVITTMSCVESINVPFLCSHLICCADGRYTNRFSGLVYWIDHLKTNSKSSHSQNNSNTAVNLSMTIL